MSSLIEPTVSSDPAAAVTIACFHVQARAEPAVMPRIMAQFAKRGLIPTQWHSSLGGAGGETLLIDLQMPAPVPALVERIAACLRQIVEVDCVLVSHKRYSRGG